MDNLEAICQNVTMIQSSTEKTMAVEAHLDELTEKHRHLDRKIEEEMSRPYADDLKIQELKRQKLKLKDELARLEAGRAH